MLSYNFDGNNVTGIMSRHFKRGNYDTLIRVRCQSEKVVKSPTFTAKVLLFEYTNAFWYYYGFYQYTLSKQITN